MCHLQSCEPFHTNGVKTPPTLTFNHAHSKESWHIQMYAKQYLFTTTTATQLIETHTEAFGRMTNASKLPLSGQHQINDTINTI